MRHSSLLSLPLVLALAACGAPSPGSLSPAPATPPAASTAPTAPTAPVASASTTPAAASAESTALTPEQKARDAALAPRAEAILDAFFNADPILVDGTYTDAALSPDGKRVLFRSNRADGVMQVYTGDVAHPDAPPTKIAGGPERYRSAQYTVDGKYLLLRRDRGADENFHILRCKPDGSDLKDLTPDGELRRERPLLPRARPDTMVYSAASTDAKATKLFVQSIATGDAKVVYTDPGSSLSADVNPAGTHALLIRWVSPSNQVLVDVDLASGVARQAYPAKDGSAGVYAAMYSADGKRIFVTTDEGAPEGSALLALDATTFAQKARYARPSASGGMLGGIVVSPRGDRLVVGVDLGHHNEVVVHDAKTLLPQRTVKAPLGEWSPGPFSRDAKRFTLVGSTPEAPPDVYAVDAATGAVTPLRADPRQGLAELPRLSTTIETVKAFDGLTIPLNVYLPADRAPGAKLPVVVDFHGGPSNSSFIGWNYRARFYTSLGWAWVQPNIRGSTGFGRAFEMADNKEKRADALKDMETVNAWVKQQPWAAPDRVVVFGGSYGGYLVLMALTRQPTLWRAGIDMCGIVNLRTFMESTDKGIRAILSPEFGDPDTEQPLLDQFSPFAQVERIVRPLFVYQGQNDPRVPRSESDQIVASLRSRSVPVEYMVAPNEGHSLERRDTRIEFLTRTARFLDDETR